MPAGNYGEALLQVADELCAELGYAGTGEIPWARSTLADEGLMAGILSVEDESLVRGLREALAKIATALGAGPEDPNTPPIRAALDGAEMTARGKLVSGSADQLPRLLPSFVFMVALPIVDQDRALELSRRTSELAAKTRG